MADGQEIKEYKVALEAALQTKYPNHNITVYQYINDDFDVPAIIVNPPRIEPAAVPPSTSKFTITLQNEVFVCYSAVDKESEIECLQVSTNIAKFINLNTWGLKITPAKVHGIEPVIVDGLENFVIQRIDFEQNIIITEKK